MPAVNNKVANVISWCAEEVERQHAGPKYVAYMYKAWERASKEPVEPIMASCNWLSVFIKAVNAAVLGAQPGDISSYRTTEVYFPDLSLAIPPRQVPDAMRNLCSIGAKNLSPGDFVFEFLKIHPFLDGNGRTASILLNWMSGSLDNPIALPDYFMSELTEEPRS